MQTWKKWLPPVYSWIPLCSVVAVNFLVYLGTRVINAGRNHYIISVPLDEKIPFRTEFIVIYLLAFVQWVLGYYLAARENEQVCYRVATGDIIAKLITCACFLILPSTINRPEVTGTGFLNTVTRWVFALDAPDNLFPSIHCLESWICFRSSLMLRKVPGWYRWLSLGFTLLVFASTVFLKQHLVVDIPGGLLVAEFGLWAAGHFGTGRIFARINAKVRLPQL